MLPYEQAVSQAPSYSNYEVESEALVSALKIYGSFFAGSFLLYIVIRQRFPLLYNFRNNVTEFNTPLAEKTHGPVRWIWCIFKHSDEEIFQYCGMDGIVLIRILRLGLKMSYVGIFNSIYLFPVYGVDCKTSQCGQANVEGNPLGKYGLNNVDKNSGALYATTVSAYVLFLSAMYFLYYEFEWFTEARHEFLRKPRPDNYTIYVANIPQEYRSDVALLEYFQTIFGDNDVIDTKIAREIPILEEKVATREEVLKKLESATYLQNTDSVNQSKYDSSCERDLDQLNSEISSVISQIEVRMSKEVDEFKRKRFTLSKFFSKKNIIMDEVYSDNDSVREGTVTNVNLAADSTRVGITVDMKNLAADSAKVGIVADMKNVAADLTNVPDSTKAALKAGWNLFHPSDEDQEGKPRDAGFVSFSRLWCKAQAIQILHDRIPFTFNTSHAPLPKNIYWGNVGLPRKQIQVGVIISNALWLALCIFYSVPVAAISFAASLEHVPFLTFLEGASQFVKDMLTILRPLLLILVSVSIPPILKLFSKYEGHISLTALEAALYSKYAVFLIIQFFYFQTLIRSLIGNFDNLKDDLSAISNTLGSEVPKQVGTLISYVLLRTFLTCILELLRVAPVIFSVLRRLVGPNLTKKERNSTWMGFLSPLSVPRTLNYPVAMSYLMINFMCLFVFSCIAPIMSVILVFVFLLLNLTYRNQLIYIYSHENDTGGQLWVRFMKLIISCMIVSEYTLIAIISSKEGYIASLCMVPLLIITVYFSKYFEEEHYKLTQYLPSILCQKADDDNYEQDLSFVKGKYVQPALMKDQVDDKRETFVLYDAEEQRIEEPALVFPSENSKRAMKKKVSFGADDLSCSGRCEPMISETSSILYDPEEEPTRPISRTKSTSGT